MLMRALPPAPRRSEVSSTEQDADALGELRVGGNADTEGALSVLSAEIHRRQSSVITRNVPRRRLPPSTSSASTSRRSLTA